MTWQRIPRETDWGARMWFMILIMSGAQHRGNGILTPVIQRLKMLVKYDQSELEAAILNAIFAAYIESPYDPEMVQAAMGKT
jgi:capsid protein